MVEPDSRPPAALGGTHQRHDHPNPDRTPRHTRGSTGQGNPAVAGRSSGTVLRDDRLPGRRGRDRGDRVLVGLPRARRRRAWQLHGWGVDRRHRDSMPMERPDRRATRQITVRSHIANGRRCRVNGASQPADKRHIEQRCRRPRRPERRAETGAGPRRTLALLCHDFTPAADRQTQLDAMLSWGSDQPLRRVPTSAPVAKSTPTPAADIDRDVIGLTLLPDNTNRQAGASGNVTLSIPQM